MKIHDLPIFSSDTLRILNIRICFPEIDIIETEVSYLVQMRINSLDRVNVLWYHQTKSKKCEDWKEALMITEILRKLFDKIYKSNDVDLVKRYDD
jgi:hypothetical protein